MDEKQKDRCSETYNQLHSNLADCCGWAVSKAFLEKMSKIALKIGAGPGFTEFP
ncbi:MAG: hypothetical protein NTY16_10105 [Deltaproteobacteria bacterium]|nr:hypothetical protein [Deltaproteobacteria bacterium]